MQPHGHAAYWRGSVEGQPPCWKGQGWLLEGTRWTWPTARGTQPASGAQCMRHTSQRRPLLMEAPTTSRQSLGCGQGETDQGCCTGREAEKSGSADRTVCPCCSVLVAWKEGHRRCYVPDAQYWLGVPVCSGCSSLLTPNFFHRCYSICTGPDKRVAWTLAMQHEMPAMGMLRVYQHQSVAWPLITSPSWIEANGKGQVTHLSSSCWEYAGCCSWRFCAVVNMSRQVGLNLRDGGTESSPQRLQAPAHLRCDGCILLIHHLLCLQDTQGPLM